MLKFLAVLFELFVLSAAVILGLQKIQSCKNIMGERLSTGFR